MNNTITIPTDKDELFAHTIAGLTTQNLKFTCTVHVDNWIITITGY